MNIEEEGSEARQLKEQTELAEFQEFQLWRAQRQASENTKPTFGTNAKTEEFDKLGQDNEAGSKLGVGVLNLNRSDTTHQVTDSETSLLQHEGIPCNVLETPESKLKRLGKGSFGVVYEYWDGKENSDKIAIKVLPTGDEFEEETSEVLKEVELHKKLLHVNIVKYLSCYQASHHLCILMELAPRGTLSQHLRSLHKENQQLEEQDIVNKIRQIVSGVCYLHNQEKPVIHRDLRSPNILLFANNLVKISDFGIAKQLESMTTQSGFNTAIGNVFWRAPETNEDSEDKRGRKTDVWSIGILMLEMIYSPKEYKKFFSEPLKYWNRLCNKRELPKAPETWQNDVLRWALLRSLVYDPAKRATAKELQKRLCGAWKEDVQQFTEEAYSTLPMYNLHKKPLRGLCLLVNNEDYSGVEGMKSRRGSNVDANMVKNIFSDMDFHVEYQQNLTKKSMKRLIGVIQGYNDLEKYSCFVAVLLSHGENESLNFVDGEAMRVDDIINSFKADTCPALADTPKWFIIQACRGPEFKSMRTSSIKTGEDDEGYEEMSDKPMSIHACADFYISYATVPGYYAFRNTITGSWFINDLCSTLKDYAHKEDVSTMMTRVNRTVSKGREVEIAGEIRRQMPCHVNMLTSALFLHPMKSSDT